MDFNRLKGLTAAPHTPFTAGAEEVWVEQVEKQAEYLASQGVAGVFVGGSTGEGLSMSLEERKQLTRRWCEVASGDLRVIGHVAHNSLPEAIELTRDAASAGVDAFATMAPCYYRPDSVEQLVAFCMKIAASAPELPFYFYDIPALTGVDLPMDRFLDCAADCIPNLAGIKYTNEDMAMFLTCRSAREGAFDMLHGRDETLLAGLALGAKGAVGSTYNFAAPLYLRLIEAFESGDMEAARLEQMRSIEMINVIAGYGYPAASKSVMGMVGVDCGPPRLPLAALEEKSINDLRVELESIGFFEWAM